MNRVRAWLLRWLGAVSVEEVAALRRAAEYTRKLVTDDAAASITAIAELNEKIAHIGNEQARLAGEILRMEQDHDAAMADVIQELNAVRNSIPVAFASQNNNPGGVRQYRNFRDFKRVMETRPEPIVIERKTS